MRNYRDHIILLVSKHVLLEKEVCWIYRA